MLFAGTELTQTMIANTIFENNTALLGGVMFIEQQSLVTCMNCTFINNFAAEGGVVAASDNGYFIFNDSLFTNNIAIAGLISNTFNSAIESSIISSIITSNIFVRSDEIIKEMNVE